MRIQDHIGKKSTNLIKKFEESFFSVQFIGYYRHTEYLIMKFQEYLQSRSQMPRQLRIRSMKIHLYQAIRQLQNILVLEPAQHSQRDSIINIISLIDQ